MNTIRDILITQLPNNVTDDTTRRTSMIAVFKSRREQDGCHININAVRDAATLTINLHVEVKAQDLDTLDAAFDDLVETFKDIKDV